MPKMLALSSGRPALVDEADWEALSRFCWFPRGCYAIRNRLSGEGGPSSISMHRVVLNAPDNMDVDHVNGDGLDNRRDNLRLATPSQNGGNSRVSLHSSRFKGVSWVARRRKWSAILGVNRRLLWLGYFDDELSAAEAYDAAALKHFGEFARLNLEGVAK